MLTLIIFIKLERKREKRKPFWTVLAVFFPFFGLGSLIIVSNLALGVRLKFPDMSQHSGRCTLEVKLALSDHLLRFSQTCELLSSKAAFTIAFFAAVNHNYDHKQRTLKHRNTQNESKSTNGKSHTWPFEPAEVKFCFLRGPLRWLMAAKNVIINLNFMIRMLLKSAVIQVHLQVVCRFVENMASHLLTKYITWCTSCQAVLFHGKITCLVPRPHYWARPMSFGSRGLSELSRIRHRNALVEKAWEEAVQRLGKVKYYHWSYNHEAFALEKKL